MTNVELRVQNIYDSLSNTEKKAADYFLGNVDNVFHMPIAQLAQEAGVSKVTWVRFCKAIGFGGLKDLKKELFTQIHKTLDDLDDSEMSLPFSDVREISNIEDLIGSIRNNSIRAIQDTAKLMDPKSLEKAALKILQARSVRIFGAGASALVGEDLQSKLLRINKNTCFSSDHHVQLTYAANMTAEDAAVLISVSGNTREILEALHLARQNDTPTIALTKYSKNPLAQNADIVLYISSPEISVRSGAMSSRIAQLMAVDALFSAVAHLDYDQIAVNLEKSLESTRPHHIRSEANYHFI